jgi:hypothetical protein
MNGANSVEGAAQAPLFSAKCARAGQAGRYLAIGGTSRLAVFSDRLEIDGQAIYFPYLISVQARDRLGAYSHVAEVVYSTADGTRAERCFSFQSLVPDKARRQLDELVGQVMTARTSSARATLAKPTGDRQALPASETETASAAVPTRCKRLADVGDRIAVAVYSARVAFPSCCPICLAEVSSVATLSVLAGVARYLPMGGMAEWLVPVCSAHRQLGHAITVQQWSVESSEVHFTFASAAYAERFVGANSREPAAGSSPSVLAAEAMRGTRFAVYGYCVGLVFYEFSRTSAVQVMRPEASRIRPGLRYSLLTVILGWWSRYGPFLVVGALLANFRGGVDVSSTVLAAARGEALLPRRGDRMAWRRPAS